jgi:hypothetical protein
MHRLTAAGGLRARDLLVRRAISSREPCTAATKSVVERVAGRAALSHDSENGFQAMPAARA